MFIDVFRKVHKEREQAFEASLRLYRDVLPQDVGVPTKLFPADPSSLQGSFPYESAVQELKQLVKDCCPQRKLDCIGVLLLFLLIRNTVSSNVLLWFA